MVGPTLGLAKDNSYTQGKPLNSKVRMSWQAFASADLHWQHHINRMLAAADPVAAEVTLASTTWEVKRITKL